MTHSVRLVAGSPAFRELVANHEVDLVVGVDAVTDVNALNELAGIVSSSDRCTVRAFLNPRRDVVFHPKFCWTRTEAVGVVIAGSGNLTERGLLGNWEAYSYDDVDSDGIRHIELTWDTWVERHAANLRPLDDAEVRRRASENNVLAQEGDLPLLRAVTSDETRHGTLQETESSIADVLIAEIPKSGNRWKQANFHKADYEEFFGARVGERRLVVFRHVDANGQLAPYEHSRPSVEVISQNGLVD